MRAEVSVNAVTLSGVLQDAVFRHTGSGKACNCALKTVSYAKDGQPRFQFFRIVLWQGLGTKAQELPPNSKVRVTGRLENSSWTDEESGEKKYRTQIVADSLEPVSGLQEIPIPKEKPNTPRKAGGTEVAAAILRPHNSAITPAYPITDVDIPF